jgi:hypothetical protein
MAAVQPEPWLRALITNNNFMGRLQGRAVTFSTSFNESGRPLREFGGEFVVVESTLRLGLKIECIKSPQLCRKS